MKHVNCQRQRQVRQTCNGSRGNAHLLQTSDLAILSGQHNAAQLAAHVVLSLNQTPAIHLAIAKLNCRINGEMKGRHSTRNGCLCKGRAEQARAAQALTRDDVPLCLVQQLDGKTNAAHRKQLQNELMG